MAGCAPGAQNCGKDNRWGLNPETWGRADSPDGLRLA
jgi:hypothetical protein